MDGNVLHLRYTQPLYLALVVPILSFATITNHHLPCLYVLTLAWRIQLHLQWKHHPNARKRLQRLKFSFQPLDPKSDPNRSHFETMGTWLQKMSVSRFPEICRNWLGGDQFGVWVLESCNNRQRMFLKNFLKDTFQILCFPGQITSMTSHLVGQDSESIRMQNIFNPGSFLPFFNSFEPKNLRCVSTNSSLLSTWPQPRRARREVELGPSPKLCETNEWSGKVWLGWLLLDNTNSLFGPLFLKNNLQVIM